MAPHEKVQDVFHCTVERTLSLNLTLGYKRTLYPVEPNELTNTVRGKHVVVVEAEDGSVRIRYGDRDLKTRAFQKDGSITQQDIEDNRRLGHVLDLIRQRQLEVSEQHRTGCHSLLSLSIPAAAIS